MGISTSFPVTKKPPCYLIPSDFSSTGEPLGSKFQAECSSKNIHRPIEEFMSRFITQRMGMNKAKLKFHEIDIGKLKKQYPHWDVEDILDFKALFQSFDLNGDGVIDFRELCLGLDELGDTTKPEERRLHFTTLDVDSSGVVDFEEYLVLVNMMLKNKQKALFYNAEVTPRNIRQLSVGKRLEHGLF